MKAPTDRHQAGEGERFFPRALPFVARCGAQFTVYALEKGGKFPREGVLEMSLGVPLRQNDNVDGAKKAMLPEGFPTGTTHSVTVNGALKMALGQHKTQARRAQLRAQANKQKNATPALP